MIARLLFCLFCCFSGQAFARETEVVGRLEVRNYFLVGDIPRTGSYASRRIKEELSFQLDVQSGNDRYYMVMNPEVSVLSRQSSYDYGGGSNWLETGVYSSKDHEVRLGQFYANALFKDVRCRLGYQIIDWGHSEVDKLVSYFNPRDNRELFYNNPEKSLLPAPLFAAMYFSDHFTLEVVKALVTSRSKTVESYPYLPEVGNFPLPVVLRGDAGNHSQEGGYGLRLTTTLWDTDFALSGYKGADPRATYVPQSTFVDSDDRLKVIVVPEVYELTMAGFEAERALGPFMSAVELAYSPNKKVLADQDLERPGQLDFPYQAVSSRWLAYNFGLNYVLPPMAWFPDSEVVFGIEHGGGKYMADGLLNILPDDYLAMAFMVSASEGLDISLRGVFEGSERDRMLWLQVYYQVLERAKLSFAYLDVDGQKPFINEIGSLFYYKKNQDMVQLILTLDFFGD